MSYLFLFDIDLTLIRTNGAGSGAMTDTLKELLGVEDGFAGVDFVGRSDRAILREALARCGHDATFEEFLLQFEQAYLPRLLRGLQERDGVLLPGARETVLAAQALEGARVGLATGNFRRAAEIKLRHFDLWHHFEDGGFGDDAERRADLVAAAIRRMRDRGVPEHARVVVIGDSVHDITAARANGALAVGVATGSASADLLREVGADYVFADLSDPASVIDAVTATLV